MLDTGYMANEMFRLAKNAKKSADSWRKLSEPYETIRDAMESENCSPDLIELISDHIVDVWEIAYRSGRAAAFTDTAHSLINDEFLYKYNSEH